MIGNKVWEIKEKAFAECRDLEEFYSPSTSVPNIATDAFFNSYVKYASLFVSQNSINNYKKADVWSDFGTISSKDIPENPTPSVLKCKKPEVTYKDGMLEFYSNTIGSEIVTEIKDDDVKKIYNCNYSSIPLTLTYHFTAYATKSGMEDSEIVSMTLVWIESKEDEASTTMSDVEIKGIPVLITSENGIVKVKCPKNKMTLSVYGIDGKNVMNSIIENGDTTLDLSANKGETIIIKIGNKSVKYLIQ